VPQHFFERLVKNMGFFETIKGQETLAGIAESLNRLTRAMERNNELMEKFLQEYESAEGRRTAKECAKSSQKVIESLSKMF